jgi:hypothetical protein
MDRFNLRRTVVDLIGEQCPPDARVCVAVGGIDSAALVMACLDVGIKPTVASFTLTDRESSDFKQGQRLADWAKLDFLPIYLSMAVEDIKRDVWSGITTFGWRTKAGIETGYPLMELMRQLALKKQPVVITGHSCDGHFCLSKRGMIHSRHTKESFQSFRSIYFDKKQTEWRMLRNLARFHGMTYIGPYWERVFFDLFADSCWEDVNRPRQKEPIRAAFPELDPLRIGNHRNYQLGDSGIAEVVGDTIRQEYAPKAKSPITAYNLLIKHYTKHHMIQFDDKRRGAEEFRTAGMVTG